MHAATFFRILPAPSGRPVATVVSRYPLQGPGAVEEVVERFEREWRVERWQEAADVLRVE